MKSMRSQLEKNGVSECVWLKTWRGKQTEARFGCPVTPMFPLKCEKRVHIYTHSMFSPSVFARRGSSRNYPTALAQFNPPPKISPPFHLEFFVLWTHKGQRYLCAPGPRGKWKKDRYREIASIVTVLLVALCVPKTVFKRCTPGRKGEEY